MVSPIVIGGPTGSGKSDYALRLAQSFGGEIICADSRQVYAGMRIGSASPTDEELALVPHHNYNVVDPKATYDAGRFIDDTDRVISEINSRGKIPILVGGTGLYLRSWRFGLSDVPQKDDGVRQALRDDLAGRGLLALFAELQREDPESADRIGPNDEFRVIRALEIFKLTGKKPSDLRKSHFERPRQKADWRLVTLTREDLNKRLLERTQKMFSNGVIEEAVALRSYLSSEHSLLQTIGYRESLHYADGVIDLPTAIDLTFIRTRQYAKRQVTWFSKEDWWSPI